jgi:hypothetical protein
VGVGTAGSAEHSSREQWDGSVPAQGADTAQDAIRALDGSDFGGRTIKVNEAQTRQGGGGGGRRY